MKACCITGVKRIPAEKLEHVRRELRREITRAVEEGYTHFISGFESDADLEFAAIVAEIKKENPALFLEAALSHPDQAKTQDERFRELITQASGVMTVSKEDGPDCSFARNRYRRAPPKSLGGREEVSLPPARVIAPILPRMGYKQTFIAPAALPGFHRRAVPYRARRAGVCT